ncbi:MAG: MBL fold metallo-hydrolase [Leptospirales bacterium]|nr:MBL fold metallo-hydrolase [Leptospirales bacterium]
MFVKEIGAVTDGVHLTGISAFPVTLVNIERPVLFEGGISCVANRYIRDIRDILAGKSPEIMFLTHAHWDHCGAASAIKKAFPSMKIAASQQSADILKKQSAIDTITRLNAEEIEAIALENGPELLTNEPFAPFEIDIILKDGDIIDIGDSVKVEVIATPGHTRDHLSYYIPSRKILFAGEAGGAFDSSEGDVIVEFVSGYEPYLSSLKRISTIPADILFQGHRIVFKGKEDAEKFLKRSLEVTLLFKPRVYELLDENGDDINIVADKLKTEIYDFLPPPKQPLGPYMINLRAQIAHLLSTR